ncbi:cell division protein FtsQ/DivIB [Aliiroseovarius subalbicans]|uniref:cell division protein FtsQ/DivIB n=1 Tax=Aliiroseovarius subalbicans TaxID=2925840 RepID=UPI001F56C728|nr:cell division protein FtsQ/DivIB [Aliiroseovarius subalbicans]MCI2398150.1 cell division protein FtsQ/DivIB [Aliiroseovarius subalbicans]
MQPMTATRPAPAAAKRDPAPSRVAYKAHRLWLTPLFRQLMRVGVPVFLLTMAVGWYFSNPTNRFAIMEKVQEVRRSVEERPEFMVKLMAVEGASPVVSDAIRQMIPVDFPVSSFDLDLDAMQAEVAELDVIERVDLRIRPGGVLEVAVTERTPVVLWRAATGLEMLDATGHRVASISARNGRADLPLLAGSGAQDDVPEALALLAAAGPLARDIRGLVRMGERRWDIVLDGEQRIQLPEQNPVQALEQVIALDQAQDLLARNLTFIDMRNPARPTLRMAAPAVEELRRIKGLELGGPAQ